MNDEYLKNKFADAFNYQKKSNVIIVPPVDENDDTVCLVNVSGMNKDDLQITHDTKLNKIHIDGCVELFGHEFKIDETIVLNKPCKINATVEDGLLTLFLTELPAEEKLVKIKIS